MSEPQTSAKLCVYYDGSCPLCRVEMDAVREADTAGRLQLIDCSASDFNAADPAVPEREALMQAMHVRDADGRWHQGIGAFEALYAAIGWQRMARFYAHPRLRPYLDRLYPYVARYRQILSRLGLAPLFARVLRLLKPRG